MEENNLVNRGCIGVHIDTIPTASMSPPITLFRQKFKYRHALAGDTGDDLKFSGKPNNFTAAGLYIRIGINKKASEVKRYAIVF